MASVNKLILMGRLGKDPSLKYTASGTAVARFPLATNESWVDKNGDKKEHTEWHNIVAWGKVAETIDGNFSKGSQAYVEGKLRTRSWEQDGDTKYITEVISFSVRGVEETKSPYGKPKKSESRRSEVDDEIPF